MRGYGTHRSNPDTRFELQIAERQNRQNALHATWLDHGMLDLLGCEKLPESINTRTSGLAASASASEMATPVAPVCTLSAHTTRGVFGLEERGSPGVFELQYADGLACPTGDNGNGVLPANGTMRLVPDGERVDVAADPDVTDAPEGAKLLGVAVARWGMGLNAVGVHDLMHNCGYPTRSFRFVTGWHEVTELRLAIVTLDEA
eukprot:CAMPEP_0181222620 /NCGR_PEP_ID=MMETSP1096-20121128/30065_1 /TAXON_ID=156174 ORGANISM="Chrysochromulina ericina, Strain CCMP281" /NCGR_SAMPLE_ID=MMETSP1096 /ASSEMBLY_ACC=CAM_ASM_000453 /LENGTH=202 /DNA_ID=CAMNT_0023315397 /DNA_START=489 /DNA_END=1100 /DNA_ORIENTATION=-